MDLESIKEKTSEDSEEIKIISKELNLDICDHNRNHAERLKSPTQMQIKSQELLKSRHKVLKQFSNKVVLQSENGRGRFLIAGEDINPDTHEDIHVNVYH